MPMRTQEPEANLHVVTIRAPESRKNFDDAEARLEKGVDKIMNDRLVHGDLRSKIVQVVAELYNNILDHTDDPIDGEIRVDITPGNAVRIVSEGEAHPSLVERFENRIDSLKLGSKSLPIDQRWAFRREHGRDRGRGLLWVVRGSSVKDGRRRIGLTRTASSTPGREHYRFEAFYGPVNS